MGTDISRYVDISNQKKLSHESPKLSASQCQLHMGVADLRRTVNWAFQ